MNLNNKFLYCINFHIYKAEISSNQKLQDYCCNETLLRKKCPNPTVIPAMITTEVLTVHLCYNTVTIKWSHFDFSDLDTNMLPTCNFYLKSHISS